MASYPLCHYFTLAILFSIAYCQSFCSQTSRQESISDELWNDPFINFQGKLLPLMKKYMCGENCEGLTTCSLRVQVDADIVIQFERSGDDFGPAICEEREWVRS
jgi:hypothetical protein